MLIYVYIIIYIYEKLKEKTQYGRWGVLGLVEEGDRNKIIGRKTEERELQCGLTYGLTCPIMSYVVNLKP